MNPRNRIPGILAGACGLLGALRVVPTFTGDGPLSGIFAVLLGSPWAKLLSSALGAVGAPSLGAATGIGLVGLGIAVNTAILYLASRWLVRRAVGSVSSPGER